MRRTAYGKLKPINRKMVSVIYTNSVNRNSFLKQLKENATLNDRIG